MSSRCRNEWPAGRAFLLTLAIAGSLLCACDREKREFQDPGRTPKPETLPKVTAAAQLIDSARGYRETAYAIAQGKQLFSWFNCTGCHSHGGGGIGPALMDDKWIYGAEPDQIYATIVEGRPNGMPSFAGRVVESQVWDLVAYVRSMSGLTRQDARPGRDDGIEKGKPEQRRKRAAPQALAEPAPR
jgi:cytochrome c oxidase cbb3-type subunit III